jgi:hypothetical protein
VLNDFVDNREKVDSDVVLNDLITEDVRSGKMEKYELGAIMSPKETPA